MAKDNVPPIEQDNEVRRVLGHVLVRGDPDEIEGFTAALTDIVASADELGDYYRMLSELADRQSNAA
jgi:ribosomal protein S4E